MITGREVYKEYMRYESDIYARGRPSENLIRAANN